MTYRPTQISLQAFSLTLNFRENAKHYVTIGLIHQNYLAAFVNLIIKESLEYLKTMISR